LKLEALPSRTQSKKRQAEGKDKILAALVGTFDAALRFVALYDEGPDATVYLAAAIPCRGRTCVLFGLAVIAPIPMFPGIAPWPPSLAGR
jgi:hypothetical protein